MSKSLRKSQLISKALLAVQNGMSLRQAADNFGCSKSILHLHLQRGKLDSCLQQTDNLTKCEEERLGNWLIYCHYMGYFKVSQTHLAKEADKFVRSRTSQRKFCREWCNEFRERQTHVQKTLDSYRYYKDPDGNFGNKWMGSLIIYCKNQLLFHCLQHPRYLYYCCQLHITDNLKMIMAYSAQGRTAPPLIINVNPSDIREFEDLLVPQGWYKYNCQELPNEREEDNGMTYYIEQILKPYLMQEDLHKPILLFNKYQAGPVTLAFYELCAEYQIYPVNSLLPAFKLDQTLQMEITVRMKSIADKRMCSYVDLIKNILIFKMTKQRMCDSFRESGIYPLAVGKINIKALPRIQMRSTLESEKELSSSPVIERDNSIASQQVESSATIVATSLKRKHSELMIDGATVSGELKKVEKNNISRVIVSGELKKVEKMNIVSPPEKRPSSISLNLNKYDQMAFQNFCLDDDDIAVCNEPLNADDSFSETKVGNLYK